jgi:hypothetical protein
MKFNRYLTMVMCGALSCLAITTKNAIAAVDVSPYVKQVTVANNSGSVGIATPIVILLPPGAGVSISFLNSDRTIEKVWLDNPAFATIDFDGCLPGGGWGDCQNDSTARIAHLRAINTLNFEGMPKSQKSLLTVVARDRNGRSSMYLFEVTKSNNSKTRVIEVMDAPPKRMTPSPQLARQQRDLHDSSMLAAAIEVGVKKAESQSLLQPNQPLKARLVKLISLLRMGTTVTVAAKGAGVSMQLIEKLKKMGGYVDVPQILNNSVSR